MRIILALIAVLAAANSAFAQMVGIRLSCAPADRMIGMLDSAKYQRLGQGIDADGDLIEVWMAPDRKFVVLLTVAQQAVSCVMSQGTDFEPSLPKANGT